MILTYIAKLQYYIKESYCVFAREIMKQFLTLLMLTGMPYYLKTAMSKVDFEHQASAKLLWNAVYRHSAKDVEKILSENNISDLNFQNHEGITLLIMATRKFSEIDKAYNREISKGDCLSDRPGRADLKAAQLSSKGNALENIIRLLISNGIDITIKDAQGKTARNYATTKKSKEIIQEALKVREAYYQRKNEGKQEIAEQKEFVPDLANIIGEYAYGEAQKDLPETESWCVIT